jgi:hypothetical protein
VFFTVTAAFGTTSDAGFVTTPPMAPVTVDCPKAIALIPKIKERTKQNFTNFDILGNSLSMK